MCHLQPYCCPLESERKRQEGEGIYISLSLYLTLFSPGCLSFVHQLLPYPSLQPALGRLRLHTRTVPATESVPRKMPCEEWESTLRPK